MRKLNEWNSDSQSILEASRGCQNVCGSIVLQGFAWGCRHSKFGSGFSRQVDNYFGCAFEESLRRRCYDQRCFAEDVRPTRTLNCFSWRPAIWSKSSWCRVSNFERTGKQLFYINILFWLISFKLRLNMSPAILRKYWKLDIRCMVGQFVLLRSVSSNYRTNIRCYYCC